MPTAPAFFRAACVAVTLLSAAAAAAAAAAEPPAPAITAQMHDKTHYRIPAGRASDTLREFMGQSKLQLLFDFEAIRSVTTRAVTGELAAREALAKMLAGTGLTFELVNDRTVAIRGATASATPTERAATTMSTQLRLAQSVEESSPRMEEKPAADTEPEEVTVTGSRIRGLLGEATVQPVYTYTRKDLDRFGAQTFAELRTYIPQLPLTNWNTQLESSYGGTPGTGTGAMGFNDFGSGLRNLGGTATLVLVDGRRVPKLGQGYSTTGSYDLSGIPLSAVERIEVLTDGASALYGADALAGVVNIILRKDFSGTQLGTHYTNTFDSDTAERQVQLSHGLRAGGLSVNLSGQWRQSNSLAPRDRWFTATLDRRPWGGTDARLPIPGAQGGVRSTNGQNLPGLNSPQAAIPVGSRGADLTIADYANTPLPERFDTPQYTDYGHRESLGARLNLAYELRPWLGAFLDGAWNLNETISPNSNITVSRSDIATQRVLLPAGYPGNPFGVPLYLDRALWEFKDLRQDVYNIESNDWVAGLRGRLPASWRYEAAAGRQWTEYHIEPGDIVPISGASSIYTRLQAAAASSDPAQRILLLNDALSYQPHPTDVYRALMTAFPIPDIREQPSAWRYDLKADGPVWNLPAGAMQLAFGGELQRDHVDLGVRNTVQNLGGQFRRETRGLFAELQVPLVSAAQGISLMHKLTANVSVRSDDYSDFEGATVPRYSLFYQPTSWLILRSSYGEGYKVPMLFQLYRVLQRLNTTVSPAAPVFDPQRNGQAWTGTYLNIAGGNPDLSPEESTNFNAGVLVDVPGVSGLSFSVDYFDLKNTNRIATPTRQDYVDFFPERVTRAAPTSTDIAAGIAGVITEIDARPVNIAYLRTRGMDFEARYQHSLGDAGQLSLRATATYTDLTQMRNTPTATTIDTTAQTPWRGTGYVAWSRGPLELSTVATYASDYLASGIISVEPVALWDFQANYDFSRGLPLAPGAWTGRLLSGASLSLKIINVFDKEPQTRLGASLGNVDPRGRRYQLGMQLRF